MSGCHGFFVQNSLTRACIAGRVANGWALDRCGARWHADHDFGPAWEAAVSMHLVNEVLDHLLGNIDVRDHAVAQGTNRLDRIRCLANHQLGIIANGLHALDAIPRFHQIGSESWRARVCQYLYLSVVAV